MNCQWVPWMLLVVTETDDMWVREWNRLYLMWRCHPSSSNPSILIHLCLFGMFSPTHLFRLFSFYRCAFQLVARNGSKNDMARAHSLHSAKPRATASLFSDWTSMSSFSKLNLIRCQQNPLTKLWLEFCWTPQIEYIRVDSRDNVPGHSGSRPSPCLISIANVSDVYLDSMFTHVSVSTGLPLTPGQLSWVLLLFPPNLTNTINYLFLPLDKLN